jgi:hypothetical protein
MEVLQDIKPRFHQPRVHGADGAEEDEVCGFYLVA